MPNLKLSLAVGEYDHVRDLTTGAVQMPGIDLCAVHGKMEDILIRNHWYKEWDVAETGFGSYVVSLDRGEQPVVAIPVFTSRIFRHSSIYVRSDSKIRSPHDLAGKRIGMPEWGMAAAVYARGMLADEYNFDFRRAKWFQGGLHDPGRKDRMPPIEGFDLDYQSVKDRSLEDMLLAGDLDVLISARMPNSMSQGSGKIRYLFDDPHAEELAYWKKTSIFPIMHFIGIRRDVYEKDRWVAMQLLNGFQEAKLRSMARAADLTAAYFPIPLGSYAVQTAKSVGGSDYWPYGVEENRPSLDAFLRYAHDQGMTKRRLTVDEMFPPEVKTITKT